MKLNQNRVPSLKMSPRALAVASALAIAASGSGAPKASASTHQPNRSNGNAEKSSKNDTPLHALTGVIAKLKEGKPVKVTAEYVGIPGPIGNAKARPIEFSEGGKKYFAYSQEHEPDFRETPAEVASTMAIVEVQLPSDNTKIPLTEAHLNRGNVLVEIKDHDPVGYSIGGNST